MNRSCLHVWQLRCTLVLAMVLATLGSTLAPIDARSSVSSVTIDRSPARIASSSSGEVSSPNSWPARAGLIDCDAQPGSITSRQSNGALLDTESDAPIGRARLVFDPNVSEEDQEAIAEAAHLAEDVFRTRFGAFLGDAVTITALPIVCPRHEERIASTIGDSMVIYTQSRGWIESPPAERLRTVIHEYAHVYQFFKTDSAPGESAAWFEEGVAEYLSMTAISELGLMDRAAVEGLFGETVHHTDLPPLEDLEDHSALQEQPGQVYPLAYFGVAQLIQNRPLSSIDTYYTALQEGRTFPEAFEFAFGMPTERFYAEFARFRADHLPTMGYLPDELRITEGVDQPSAVKVEGAPRFVIPDQQALVMAVAQPGSNCTLDLMTADMATAIQDRDTFANGAGRVFWLLTIPADAATGEGTIVVSCGADPVTIPVLIA